MAQRHYANGNYFDALAHIDNAYRLNPTDKDILEWRGEIAIRLDDYKTAAEVLTRARDNFADEFQDWSQLGLALYECHKPAEAVEALTRAIQLNPDDKVAHANLGRALYEMSLYNDQMEARLIAQKWLSDYPQNPDARHIGASLAKNLLPDRANADYVEGLFDDFAEVFDQILGDLHYKTPQQMIQILKPHCHAKAGGLKILDLGCGTGLLGQEFMHHISHPIDQLVGVDLSYKMLQRAESRAIYSDLIHADIMDYLQLSNLSFDIIMAGDVLCYFGLLDGIIPLIKYALKPSGLFVFSAESAPAQTTSYHLHESGRYQHHDNYFDAIMLAHTMPQLDTQKLTLRFENHKPVAGTIKLWQKTILH